MKRLLKKSILVVDDDEGMLRALDKVLTGEGAAVTSGIWAGDALESLTQRGKQFDLVITDLRMPFMKGERLVSAIKTMFPEMPVIVLTAYGSAEMKALCLQQGAAAVLEKPLDSHQLFAAIESALATANADGFKDARKSEKP